MLWKTRSGSDPKCAKAGKDFHMQAGYAEKNGGGGGIIDFFGVDQQLTFFPSRS